MKITNLQRYDVMQFDADDQTYFTKEGYLIDHPIVTRIGIFTYHNKDGTVRKEFRPPDEVFNDDSLNSYEGKPVIVTHDGGYISKDNVTDEEVGTILSPGYKDGDSVRAKIVIHDTDTMKRSGLKELSLGYNLDLDETPGVYNGEHYDAVQRNIRINHLALVGEARAGDSARLNIDSKDIETGKPSKGGEKMGNPKDAAPMKEADFEKKLSEFMDQNGKPTSGEEPPKPAEETKAEPENKDVAEPTIAEKVQAIRDRQQNKDSDAPETQQDKDIATLLDCIDAMDAEKDLSVNADCKTKTDAEDEKPEGDNPEDESTDINTDAVDKIISEKLGVLRVGDKLNMDGLEKMSLRKMKEAIIKRVNPGMRLDGKSLTYINTAYEITVDHMDEMKKDANYQKRQMMGAGMNMDSSERTQITGAMAARERMIHRNEGGNN